MNEENLTNQTVGQVEERVFPGSANCLTPPEIDAGVHRGWTKLQESHLESCSFCQGMLCAWFRSTCPPMGLLVQFVQGLLDCVTLRGIEGHVLREECSRCELAIGAIEGGWVQHPSTLAEAFLVPAFVREDRLRWSGALGENVRLVLTADAGGSMNLEAHAPKEYAGRSLRALMSTAEGSANFQQSVLEPRGRGVSAVLEFDSLPASECTDGFLFLPALLSPVEAEAACLDPGRMTRYAFGPSLIPRWDRSHIEACGLCRTRLDTVLKEEFPSPHQLLAAELGVLPSEDSVVLEDYRRRSDLSPFFSLKGLIPKQLLDRVRSGLRQSGPILPLLSWQVVPLPQPVLFSREDEPNAPLVELESGNLLVVAEPESGTLRLRAEYSGKQEYVRAVRVQVTRGEFHYQTDIQLHSAGVRLVGGVLVPRSCRWDQGSGPVSVAILVITTDQEEEWLSA